MLERDKVCKSVALGQLAWLRRPNKPKMLARKQPIRQLRATNSKLPANFELSAAGPPGASCNLGPAWRLTGSGICIAMPSSRQATVAKAKLPRASELTDRVSALFVA